MLDWPLALSTASHAISLVQELRGVDREFNQAELKLKIADLTSTLADLKITLTQAKSDAHEMEAEIARLKSLHRRLVDETIELNG